MNTLDKSKFRFLVRESLAPSPIALASTSPGGLDSLYALLGLGDVGANVLALRLVRSYVLAYRRAGVPLVDATPMAVNALLRGLGFVDATLPPRRLGSTPPKREARPPRRETPAPSRTQPPRRSNV
jgi:hypothetical protein